MRAGLGQRLCAAAPHDLFDALFKLPAREQDPAPAGGADQANIGAKTYDLPFVSAAGMRLAEPYDVVQIEFERQSGAHYIICNGNSIY